MAIALLLGMKVLANDAYPRKELESDTLRYADLDELLSKSDVITPHISWAPKESRQRLMDIAVDNLKKFIEGTPVNVVNK